MNNKEAKLNSDTDSLVPVFDVSGSVEELQALGQTVIRESTRLGNSACAVSMSEHKGLSASVRLGEVETVEQTQDRGLSVVVYRGQSKGSASSADLRVESIRDCVAKATDIARFTEPDRFNGLPDTEFMATEPRDLDCWHPASLDAEAAIERALEIETAAREADKRISNSEGASVSVGRGISVLANSLGFAGATHGTRYSQSCAVIAGSGPLMQRDYWYDTARALPDLDEPALTGQIAAKRTLARLDSRPVPTCQVPVLFTADVARSLIGHYLSAVSGSALYRNASFLKDALGTSVFPGWLSVSELPFIPRGAGSAWYDNEGVATRERDLVADGRVETYLLNSYSARRLKSQTTGHAGGVRNCRLNPGSQSFDELVRQMDRGLIVNEVMGQGVSIVTGDYSRGAAGFWVENGSIVHPVQEVTIAANLRDLFSRIVAVGNDLDTRGNIQTPSLLVNDLTVAGS